MSDDLTQRLRDTAAVLRARRIHVTASVLDGLLTEAADRIELLDICIRLIGDESFGRLRATLASGAVQLPTPEEMARLRAMLAEGDDDPPSHWRPTYHGLANE